MRTLIYLPLALLSVGLCVGVEGLHHLNRVRDSLPPALSIASTRPPLTTRILSRDGRLLATLFKENRTWTPLKKISPALRRAVIAIEDRRFYSHKGVDQHGIARAALSNWRGNGIQEGASTLTMQLVRNVLKDKRPTYERKLREAMMAWELEKHLSKDRILEMYLNQVYFGHGCYGVASASRYYFGKGPEKLSVGEAALLAGLPQSPEFLANPKNQDRLKQRQIMVLQAMLEQKKIDYKKYRAVLDHNRIAGIPQRRYGGNQVVLRYPYFTSYVIRQLSQKFDRDKLYGGGLTIVTTLDIRSQRIAESTVRNVLDYQGYAYNAGQAALVAIDNKSGHIQAMVGGRQWKPKDQFNRAWQAQRQAGSTFKAFVYATAIENGMSMTSVVSDSPASFSDGHTVWTPQNSDGRFLGPLPLWRALMLSRNVCSANLISRVGPQKVLNRVHKLNMGQKLGPHLSIALGAVDVSPLQMAAGYSTLVNDGVFREPVSVLKVTDHRGRTLWKPRSQKRRVFSKATSRTMTVMLQNVVKGGTGTAAAIPGQAVAGKTGTSDHCKDAWFAGYTPRWTTCVWVGNDNQQPMYGCYGGTLPARIWHDFMVSAAPRATQRNFTMTASSSAQRVSMCQKTHQRAARGCGGVYYAVFDRKSVPQTCHTCSTPRSLPVQYARSSEGVPVYTNVDYR